MRVLICDDHTLIRAGLRRLVESFDGIEVVGDAASGDEAVMRTRELHPHVVLLDLSMPGRNGFDTLEELRRVAPDTAVVIMSMHDDGQHVREALARGANGFVVKEAAPAELDIALRAAFAGQVFLSPQVSSAMLGDAATRPRKGADPSTLPPRQREILAALGAGRTTKQIAADLGISIKTVETHRARLMEALGCRNAVELVRTAVQWSARVPSKDVAPR
ncbi:response regulator transcription factor [Lysobacter sp. HA18]